MSDSDDNGERPNAWDMSEEEVEALTSRLRAKAAWDHDHRIHLDTLDTEHRETLGAALRSLLSTELAILTYAQIVDGLPLEEVVHDQRSAGIFGDHPIDAHEELCPGALEKAHELCQSWNLDMLKFSPQLVHTFQQAAPGSKMFETRLLELVAVAIHQFAVIVYHLDFRLHQGDIDSVINYLLPLKKPDDFIPPPRPTLFNHSAYLDHTMYPEGVADMVGYWAESRILGGVVLFDRETELKAPQLPPPNVYFHSSRLGATMLVYQLYDEQQQSILDFLLNRSKESDKASASTVSCPFPINQDLQNVVRVEPWCSLTMDHIFRDVWERKPYTGAEIRFWQRRPHSTVDYPGLARLMFQINEQAGTPIPKKTNEDGTEEDCTWVDFVGGITIQDSNKNPESEPH